jgi:hypothetical protein
MNPKQSSSNEPTSKIQESTTEKVPIKTKPTSEPTNQSQDKAGIGDLSKSTPDINDEKVAEPAVIANKPGEVINPASASGTAATTNPVEIDPSTFSAQPESQALPNQAPASVENTGPHANLQNAPAIVAPNRPRKGLRWLLILLVVLFLATGSVFAYLEYVAPERAVQSYVSKLTQVEATAFNGRLDLKSASSEAEKGAFSASTRFSGQYNGKNSEDERFDVTIDGNIGYLGVNVDVKLALISAESALYLRPEQLGPLETLFGQSDISNHWYKLPFEEDENGSSTLGFEDRDCTDEDLAAIENYIQNELSTRLKPQDLNRVGLLRENIDGHSVTHYSGVLKGEQIIQIIEEINQKLSEDCREDVEDAEELRQVNMIFDLWTSDNFDRLQLNISGLKAFENLNITLDTHGYNQEFDIQVPTDSKLFEDLFNFETESPPVSTLEFNEADSFGTDPQNFLLR